MLKNLVCQIVIVCSSAICFAGPGFERPAANDDFGHEKALVEQAIDRNQVFISRGSWWRPESRDQVAPLVSEWFARPDSVQAPEVFTKALPALIKQAQHVQRAMDLGGSHERIELIEILRRPEWRSALASSGLREQLRYGFPNSWPSILSAATDMNVAKWIFDEEDLSFSDEFAAMAERLANVKNNEATWRFSWGFRDEALKQLKWSEMKPLYREKFLGALKLALTNGEEKRELFRIALHILPPKALQKVIDSAGFRLSEAIAWSWRSLSDQQLASIMKMKSGPLFFNVIRSARGYGGTDQMRLLKFAMANSTDVNFILSLMAPAERYNPINADSEDRREIEEAHAAYLTRYSAAIKKVYEKIVALGATYQNLRSFVGYVPEGSPLRVSLMDELFAKATVGKDALQLFHLANSPQEKLSMWTKYFPRILELGLPAQAWADIDGNFPYLPNAVLDMVYAEAVQKVRTPEEFLAVTQAIGALRPNIVAKAIRLWPQEVMRFYPAQITKEQLIAIRDVRFFPPTLEVKSAIDFVLSQRLKKRVAVRTCESLFN